MRTSAEVAVRKKKKKKKKKKEEEEEEEDGHDPTGSSQAEPVHRCDDR